MKIRLISGACYIALLVAFFCLKIFLPYGEFYFDALIWAFALLGTFEMLRAVKDKTTAPERVLVFLFALVTIPVCALGEYFFGAGIEAVGVCFFALALALLSLIVFAHEETSLEGLGLSLLSAVYPTVLLSLLVLTNHMSGSPELAKFALDSNLMILLIFVVSPCADSIAYVFGLCFKKYFPKKMAPVLSPKKTVIGGIGGLVGGMLGAAILYFTYNGVCGSFDQMHIWLPVYILVGLLAAIATEFGDLVESGIKRKLDIKDMGKIMPGHGGCLDRIDGTLFATVVVYISFVIIHMVV